MIFFYFNKIKELTLLARRDIINLQKSPKVELRLELRLELQKRRSSMIGLAYILDLEKITVAELSNTIDIDVSLIYRWIKGTKSIPQKRIIQLHRMFPIYPAEYIGAELSESDKVYLANIKFENNIADITAATPLLEMKKAIKEMKLEQQRIIDETQTIVDIKSYDDMRDEDKVSPNVLLTMLSMVAQEQSLFSHDYKALNNLEKLRKVQNNDSSSFFLISVVLSALCCVFGIEDNIDNIVFTPSFKIRQKDIGFSNELIQSHIDVITERRNDIIAFFKNIIDECNKEDAAKAATENLINNNQ